jgi:hypothetical protein
MPTAARQRIGAAHPAGARTHAYAAGLNVGDG